MATVYQCICSDCTHAFTIHDGGGMTYQQLLCDQCGKAIHVPRYAPRPRREGHNLPPFLQRGNYKPSAPIAFQDIQRFSTVELKDFLMHPKRWPRLGDSWDAYEIQEIFAILGHCACGGEWTGSEVSPDNHGLINVPHSYHRCPECRSRAFTYEATALLD